MGDYTVIPKIIGEIKKNKTAGDFLKGGFLITVPPSVNRLIQPVDELAVALQKAFGMMYMKDAIPVSAVDTTRPLSDEEKKKKDRKYEYIYIPDEEKRTDKDRFLILKEIMNGAGIDVFYNLAEMQAGKPYYVPDNLAEIKGHVVTEQERKLVDYIENLKSTSPVIRLKYNKEKTKPSPHQGKKLKDFTYISDDEDFEIRWLSGKCEHGPKKPQEKKLREYLESIEGTFAEKIFRDFRFRIFTGWTQFMQEIKYFMDSLNEIGVEFSMEEANYLLSMIQDFSNNSHLYINRGWTPMELSDFERKMNPGPQTISFGPGIMQAVKEGKISLEELKKQAEAMGLKVKL